MLDRVSFVPGPLQDGIHRRPLALRQQSSRETVLTANQTIEPPLRRALLMQETGKLLGCPGRTGRRLGLARPCRPSSCLSRGTCHPDGRHWLPRVGTYMGSRTWRHSTGRASPAFQLQQAPRAHCPQNHHGPLSSRAADSSQKFMCRFNHLRWRRRILPCCNHCGASAGFPRGGRAPTGWTPGAGNEPKSAGAMKFSVSPSQLWMYFRPTIGFGDSHGREAERRRLPWTHHPKQIFFFLHGMPVPNRAS